MIAAAWEAGSVGEFRAQSLSVFGQHESKRRCHARCLLIMTIRTKTLTITATSAADAKAWAKELDCTAAELRIAIRAVGNSTARVRSYLDALKGRGSSSICTAPAEQLKPTGAGALPKQWAAWPQCPSSDPDRYAVDDGSIARKPHQSRTAMCHACFTMPERAGFAIDPHVSALRDRAPASECRRANSKPSSSCCSCVRLR